MSSSGVVREIRHPGIRCGDNCCAILLAFIAPPLAICCYKGCNKEAWICLLLLLLVPYVGGVIYALIVISCGKDRDMFVGMPRDVVVVETQP